MNTEKPLINRVANSGLVTINLEDYYPRTPTAIFDLKDYLFKELILKEKDFRTALKEHDWTQYEGKHLLVYCSTDAIVPMWAYMLIAAYAAPHTEGITQGKHKDFVQLHYQKSLNEIDFSQYKDQRIVIKGCSTQPVPALAYTLLTEKLRHLAKSIMFGEPCSTVPVFKKPRK